MRISPTAVAGAYLVVPEHHRDDRGTFYEGMRTDRLDSVLDTPFTPRQVSYSVSRRNTLRGIHLVAVPPGQVKYVTCVRGALRDVIVDLRPGSPTYLAHDSYVLDAPSGRSVHIPDGVGHGFLALTDDTCICYLMSTVYAPGTQIDVNPLDPELALPWELSEPPLMSDKDRHAPGLAEVLASGRLTGWAELASAAGAG